MCLVVIFFWVFFLAVNCRDKRLLFSYHLFVSKYFRSKSAGQSALNKPKEQVLTIGLGLDEHLTSCGDGGVLSARFLHSRGRAGVRLSTTIVEQCDWEVKSSAYLLGNLDSKPGEDDISCQCMYKAKEGGGGSIEGIEEFLGDYTSCSYDQIHLLFKFQSRYGSERVGRGV